MYRVLLSQAAANALRQLPSEQQPRMANALRALAHWPRPQADVRPLKGKLAGYYRLRVGNLRAIFEAADEHRVIRVIRIGPRGRVYS